MAPKLHNGDVVLTGLKAQGLVSYAIKLGSKLRFGFKSPYTRFSHSSIVINADRGLVCEALGNGVRVRSLAEHHTDDDFVVIPTGEKLEPLDWLQIKRFLDSVIAAKWKYGRWTFAGLALYCLTGSKLCVQSAGTSICSGLVCDALTRAGYVWERPPFAMTPSDIAAHFEVQ